MKKRRNRSKELLADKFELIADNLNNTKEKQL